MGYPMTWKRVVARNGLATGGYDDSALLGDLRRLEADAQDERALCLDIERRSGIKREVVAAVLKEFFNV